MKTYHVLHMKLEDLIIGTVSIFVTTETEDIHTEICLEVVHHGDPSCHIMSKFYNMETILSLI